MTKLFTQRKPFFLAVLLAAVSLSSGAGDGHDHGEAPATVASPSKPRFTATSEDFELVGVVHGTRIALYLDHAADNRPVKDAKLELELGGTNIAAQPHGEGEFEATLARELPPGEVSVTATVFAGTVTDLLAGELDIHADTLAPAAQGATWKTYSAWAIGGLLALALLAFAVRRRGAQRNTRLGGAA
jgi:hypothetical protein